MAARNWQTVAYEQQAILREALPQQWLLKTAPPESVLNVMDVPYTSGIMTERELHLTEKDATTLIEMLAKREVTSYDLTLAFCKRATIAQQVINCLTQLFVDEALQQAKELDDYLEKNHKVIGPYHGLPFSIKDQINIKGKDSSGGFVSRVGWIAAEDAPTVKLLREAGAVFYCKTNNPQTLMHLESNSNIYGRTVNPFNRSLTCGGSSGGEGALVGFRGAPIGLAADGGGSIRSPAANNGVYGMKTTSGRIPTANSTRPMNGCESFPVVVGPICRSARDFEYFQTVILDREPWKAHPAMVPIRWRQQPTPDKLTIGVFSDDGVCRPHPPVEAAIAKLTARLSKSPDIKVVQWEPYKHDYGYDLIQKLFFEDGGDTMWKAMKESGEPALPLTEWILNRPQSKRRTIEESWALNVERESYRKEYLDYWNQHPEVDVLLCPVGPGVAPKHDTSRYWGYTAIFNCLDWPAIAFPTGLSVSIAEHPIDATYQPRDNEYDQYNWPQYDPEVYREAPISLQLVGKKWDCEIVMAALRKLELELTKYP